MSTLSLTREEIDALIALGATGAKKGVQYVTIPLVSLEGLLKIEQKRVGFDDKLEAFKAIVMRYTTNADGIVEIPLVEFVRHDVKRPDAPLSNSQAQQQSTWAGLGVGSRLAFDAFRYATKVRPVMDPETGLTLTTIELHKMSAEEIAVRQNAIDKAGKRKSSEPPQAATEPAALPDEETPIPEPVVAPSLAGQSLSPVS